MLRTLPSALIKRYSAGLWRASSSSAAWCTGVCTFVSLALKWSKTKGFSILKPTPFLSSLHREKKNVSVDTKIGKYPFYFTSTSGDLGIVADAEELIAATPPTALSLVPIPLGKLHREQSWEDLSQKVFFSRRGERVFSAPNNLNVLFGSTDGFEVIWIPLSLVARVLRFTHHAETAGHSHGRCLYQFLRRSFFWLRMSSDCYAVL